MEIINIKDLSFQYILSDKISLNNVSLSINTGDFMVICGDSGCGKSTLLKQLKKELTPNGYSKGSATYKGVEIKDMDTRSSATSIGFVMQNPDNQIVTDKVWHELAFGLENIGEDTQVIRRRVAEMANFFGIQDLFREDSDSLSGGQKQLLNLASTMILQPDVLILDEPTSQLDPIAGIEFVDILKKINDEFGTTIVIVEHRLDEVFKVANRVVLMDKGSILAQGSPYDIALKVKEIKPESNFFLSLPTPTLVANALPVQLEYLPVSIKEGKIFLNKMFANAKERKYEYTEKIHGGNEIVKLENIYFRYEKDQDDILRGVNLSVKEGEFYAMLGGNGAGKTTTINNIAGILKPYRGKIKICGNDINKKGHKLPPYFIGYLPQNPTLLFSKDSVIEELKDDIKTKEKIYPNIKQDLEKLIEEFRIGYLLEQHPYDISGGEQQKVAMVKILLNKPSIMLLDEPTKGLDAYSKKELAYYLTKLRDQGITIMMVSHDVEFCAAHSDRCAMFFDGDVISVERPREFFKDNSFYTTAAAKLTRGIFENTILSKDVIDLCLANLKSSNM